MSHLRAYKLPIASYSGTRKPIWDHYIDIAREVDILRETELTDLADTVLVFVNNALHPMV
jgi:hypothetical protein